MAGGDRLALGEGVWCDVVEVGAAESDLEGPGPRSMLACHDDDECPELGDWLMFPTELGLTNAGMDEIEGSYDDPDTLYQSRWYVTALEGD